LIAAKTTSVGDGDLLAGYRSCSARTCRPPVTPGIIGFIPITAYTSDDAGVDFRLDAGPVQPADTDHEPKSEQFGANDANMAMSQSLIEGDSRSRADRTAEAGTIDGAPILPELPVPPHPRPGL
jgi:hypothetical protein